jgi:hypothetical protein
LIYINFLTLIGFCESRLLPVLLPSRVILGLRSDL